MARGPVTNRRKATRYPALGRRDWIARCAGLGFAVPALLRSRVASAGPLDADPLQIDLPQLQYSGRWNPRPHVMRELGIELRLRSRLEPVQEPSIVTAEDEALFATPFLYVAGEGGFPSLGETSERRLQRFVDLGGLLVFDDADGGLDHRFVEDVRGLISRILPGRELRPIAAEHVLYRSFYLIDAPAGRTRLVDHNLGVQEEGRLKVVVLPNDLGGALARGRDGSHIHSCAPGGSVQREWATRLAINLLLYATCTDYKSDRAHVETLLRRRERPF
jgi:hypothetical protein